MFLDKEVGEMHTPLSRETFICARESVFLPLAGEPLPKGRSAPSCQPHSPAQLHSGQKTVCSRLPSLLKSDAMGC